VDLDRIHSDHAISDGVVLDQVEGDRGEEHSAGRVEVARIPVFVRELFRPLTDVNEVWSTDLTSAYVRLLHSIRNVAVCVWML
jgi:hypothetical protein